MKVLFFGTPRIAVPYLDWLQDHHSVVGVVCQPDKPAGRGYEIQAPPVKVLAREKNIPVFQPSGPWDASLLNQLKKTDPELGIAVAYGRLLPESIFRLPRHGTLNVHFSLLPRYRGAAPMQWALINGDKETGVSLFWLEKELDSGPIFNQQTVSIDPLDDANTLEQKLIPAGLRILEDALNMMENGRFVKTPQSGAPTFAPTLRKEIGHIRWDESAPKIVNLIRGICHWPGAVTSVQSHDGAIRKIKIIQAAVAEPTGSAKNSGTITEASETKGLLVQAGSGVVSLRLVQAEGKKAMTAWAFWQGAHLKPGDTFQ